MRFFRRVTKPRAPKPTITRPAISGSGTGLTATISLPTPALSVRVYPGGQSNDRVNESFPVANGARAYECIKDDAA